MSSVNIEIKGIRSDIQLEELGKDGWKKLISVVKGSPEPENLELRSKYLSRPLELVSTALREDIDFRNCKACNRPVIVSEIVDHLENHCIEKMPIKKGELQDMISSPGKGKGNGKRSASVDLNSADSPSKKQRPSTPSSTRKQRKIKQRNPTAPHLVDLDKQCGVPLPEGGVCGRSLTCKTHSMGAKRAVQGRSKPFDILLAEYQKRNQLKSSASKTRIQKAQRNPDDAQARSKSKDKNGSRSNNNDASSEAMNNLTPEEETTLVLNGVSRSYPLPLESTVLTSARSRTKYIRMREMFASAFNIKPGFKGPGVGAFRSRVGLVDIDRTTDYTFRIRTPQPVNPTPQNLTPEQLQALQSQRIRQQQQQQQQQHQQHQQRQISPNPTTSLLQMQMQMQPPGNQTGKASSQQPMMTQGITPRDIQTQQLIMQQQQQKLLQKKRMEDASAQLDTASKLMQHSIGSPVNMQRNSNQQGVPYGMNGYGGRVN